MALTYSSTRLLDAIMVSSTAAVASNASTIPYEVFGPNKLFSFGKGLEYYFAFKLFGEKLVPTFDARIDVYLSGSAFPSNDKYGYQLDSIICKVGDITKNYGLIENEFLALEDGTARLQFVVYSGIWHLANFKLQVASWPGYNPDEATIDIPVDGIRYRKVKFKAELYDANNNAIPTNNFIIESDELLLSGSNTVIQGVDNRIVGTVVVSLSGSGAVIGTDVSGSYIGIQSGVGTQSLPRPVYSPALPDYIGPPIIVMYSGSLPYTDNSANSGSAMGLQIASGTPSGSFFDFNTLTGLLTIRGAIELLPDTPLSASLFASGSAGTTALEQIQALINGSSSFLPSGTFINGNMVISPIIAGNFGYFTSQFGVGNIAGGNGIVLTALGFSSSDGTYQLNAPAIFIGKGQVGNQNTPFLVGSASNGPVFSLGDRLVAQMSGSKFVVKVSGSLAIDQFGTGQFQDIRGVITGISDLFTTELNYSSSIASASLYAVSASITQTQTLANAQLSASIASVSASVVQASATGSVVDSVNKIRLPTSIKTFPGLYLESASIGFWQPFAGSGGSSSVNYPVIINSDGSFRFAGSGSWSGSVANGAFVDQIGFNNGNLLVQTKNILVSTPGLQFAGLAVSASSANFIKLGVNSSAITLANGAGFYVDGAGNFRVGNDSTGSDYIQQTAGSNLIISSSGFFLGTPTLRIGSTGNSGVIKLGANASNISLTRNAGFYVDGAGNFRVGSDTSGSDYILLNVGNALLISSSQYYLKAPHLQVNSFTSGGLITLGNATTVDSGSGFYADGNSHFRLGAPGTASLTYDPNTGALAAKNIIITANAVSASQVTSTNASFQNMNALEVSVDDGITAQRIIVENQTINTGSKWNNVSGSAIIGPYSVNQVSTNSTINTTGSLFPGASDSNAFAASSTSPDVYSIFTKTVALNGSGSAFGTVTMTVPFSCTVVSNSSSISDAETDSYASVLFAWAPVGGTFTTIASHYYTTNTTITFKINVPAYSDFQLRSTLRNGATFVPAEHGGYLFGSSNSTVSFSSASWQYFKGTTSTNTLQRYGAAIAINPEIQSPHIHLNASSMMSASSLTAGDIWFEASGSQESQAQGTLKYFDGGTTNNIVGGAETFDNGVVSDPYTVDWSNSPHQWITLNVNTTINFKNGQLGVPYWLYIRQPAGSAKTITWVNTSTPAGFVISTTPSVYDVIQCMQTTSRPSGTAPVWRVSMWAMGFGT